MSLKLFFIILMILILFFFTQISYGKLHKKSGSKYNLKFLRNHRGIGGNIGLWPSVFNLATKADISANATCGIIEREEFCKLSENGKGIGCGICDPNNKKHSIQSAIDGSNKFWQSPPLFYGSKYEFVTITVDLKQIYQIAYVVLKAANSPRPGCWILEKSVNGMRFEPWQYFARNDKECLEKFGVPATRGKPRYYTDTEVICTSFFSKLTPLENGEVHISLIQGRPAANDTSPELLEFTKARFVQFRFLGLRGSIEPIPKWLNQDPWKDKKLFYSIRDISIGGQCVCNGHAENCRHHVASGHPECECQHHTCGPNCEKCCSFYNQRPWSPGSSRNAQQCEKCNCHGHAENCRYDEEIDRAKLSMNIKGSYEGGGVCENCTDFTTGINCEKCLNGFFRPEGILPSDPRPCNPCECSIEGSIEGMCVQYGPTAGTCLCKPNYFGLKCDSCASEFRGYPNCESCPCDPKGIISSTTNCEGDCICKENVEGTNCDRCKAGYFGLSSDHPEGCLKCFCSGVTSLCELALVKSKTIQTLLNWLMTDLKVRKFIIPVTSTSSVYTVGNYGLPGVENLYWFAPKEYLGNKLESYGSNFVFNVQWVVMRGDTSGEPTIGPDMIIIGNNGLQLAYNNNIYNSQRMSFKIPLNEVGWYVIPDEIFDITTRMAQNEYNKGAASREEFLSVLIDIKYILLRGTYHTDQIEALLEGAIMSFGNEDSNYEKGSVEKCSCPSGYTGLSCENCSFGYVRIYLNGSSGQKEGYCGKCDCNGHSETCNADTGECFCQHNTIGEKCERCAVGFYGNPLRGTVEDCKKCACPLENVENNFSPSCQLDNFNLDNDGGFVCTQCPIGYTGDHCEICDDGHYGNPQEIGNNCKPCDCNGGPCDRKTGQCLACKGNTAGFKCEKCKTEHYGDPTNSNCRPCECDIIGSLSRECDQHSGQCNCKNRFVGLTCDQCEKGYGNITALCPRCECDPKGSKTDFCNSHTGICDCLPGVEGFRCDACQNLHWGFSNDGCKACNCDPNGSKYSSCDPINGQCVCKSHYEGRICDNCKEGYWKTLKKDCIKCHCNEFGSLDNFCNQETGQCSCKIGVNGQNCDKCLPNYYGTVETECIECEPCSRKGHVCGKGGKCLCPPLTIGAECERCSIYSWGFEPKIGCKTCNCSNSGSNSLQCDKLTGNCSCKTGYEGIQCNRCAFGYFGYPNCKKCLCNLIGTLEKNCRNNGDCLCNANGTCNCKENVMGIKCNSCKNGTFGLNKENPKGCKECFCFGRSTQCVDTKYNWDKIRFEKIIESSNEPISSDTISLPKHFTGDLTTSYDGYLSVNGSGGKFSVYLTGNGISLKSSLTSNELRINEGNWIIISEDIPQKCQYKLTRECFLLVLEKVTSVVVQSEIMEITEVLLDSAKQYIPYNRTSHSIEKCDCPLEYSGLSCQDPNKGFYRYYPDRINNNEITENLWIDSIIGIARPCNCNGRSQECDADSGQCTNCLNNTAGYNCELCATGFYKDGYGMCRACQCPSEFENNAENCVVKKHGFSCQCKKGYTGSKCENCKDSYYRDLHANKCVSCNCNNYGSHSSVCDIYGTCLCKPGFHGDKCNQCKNPKEFIKDGYCTPCDECTQLLFKEIDHLSNTLDTVNDQFKDGISPPWKFMESIREKYENYNKTFYRKYKKSNDFVRATDLDELERKMKEIQEKAKILDFHAGEYFEKIKSNSLYAEIFKQDLINIQEEFKNMIKVFEEFGKKHVNLGTALENGIQIVHDMKFNIKNHIKQIQDNNNAVLEYCNAVEKQVNNFYLLDESPVLPCNKLKEINEKVDEINFITEETEIEVAKVKFQNEANKRAIDSLEYRLIDLEDINDNINNDNDDIALKIEEINKKISKLNVLISDIESFDFTDLDGLKSLVEKFEKYSPELQELADFGTAHVRKLKNIVENRISVLNFTKAETEKIETGTAYSDIIKGIAEAENTTLEAEKILEKALNYMEHPPGEDDLNLIKKSNVIFAISDRMQYRMKNMGDINSVLNARKNDLDNFKATLIDSGRINNNLTRRLQQSEYLITSKEPLVEKLYDTIKDSSNIINEMQALEKQIGNLNIKNNLIHEKKHYDQVKSETENQIEKTTDAVNSAIKVATSFLNKNQIDDERINSGQIKLDKVTQRINELKNKILYAKQAAETINVAVALANCSMKYISPLPQAEVFRTLSITFKCKSCKLLNWVDKNLEIFVKNGTVGLNNTITHEIAVSGKQGDVEREKTVFVEKSGSLLKIRLENEIKWQSLSIGDRMFVIDPTDKFHIENYRRNDNGYISKFSINNNNVGLWKFHETNGKCNGEARISNKDLEGGRPFYAGNGYRKYNSSTLAAAKFNLQFYVSTFDENALIYLSQEIDNPSAFIALTLEEGYFKFDVHHNNGTNVTLKTRKKFNNGKAYLVNIAMAYSNKKQSYKLETPITNDSINKSLDNKEVFRIRKALHYLGGIAPTVKKDSLDVNTKSLLGFLVHISPQLTNEVISSGVIQKSGELQLFKAWFNGNGTLHLRFPLKKSEKFESLSFILRPLQANTAIMDIEHFGTITLSNRLLQINLINGEHYLADSNNAININDYNVISIKFHENTIELIINGFNQNISRTKSNELIFINRDEADVNIIVGSVDQFDLFYGGISDISINEINLPFNSTTVIKFANVEIGREDKLIRPTITLKGLQINNNNNNNNNVTNIMQNTQGCATSAAYVTDPTAVNFVDQLDSFIKVKSDFLKQKDFKLEFDFRTFYPNGLIFIAVGSSSPPQYNLLHLKEGILIFHFKGKRKIPKNWPLKFTKRVDDGVWHSVKIQRKNGKKLQIFLDEETQKPVRYPKVQLKNEIFFGNVPNREFLISFGAALKEMVQPFRGCLNNVKINGETKLVGKNTTNISYRNIRQCFPKIEEGAYFGGDAYAIYKEGFRINKILDLSFQFRTAEQNGILLTISNELNYPALSMELQTGAVVMTVDLGNGFQSMVTNNLDSDFALCDNLWHNVSATYSSSELTVNVDGIRKSWVQSDVNSLMDQIDAPLYVGGLPDNVATGTLKTKENFKGCIKNLRIDNDLKDWSKMEELNGVLLNSCPVLSVIKNS